MNRVILCGRLTSDPRVNSDMTVARFSLAVDRKYKRDGDVTTDFFNCVAFGKTAEFVEKYLNKGTKVIVEGRLQTGSYEKDGHKINTVDIVAESVEFAESKNSNGMAQINAPIVTEDSDFMKIPDEIGEELPFV